MLIFNLKHDKTETVIFLVMGKISRYFEITNILRILRNCTIITGPLTHSVGGTD